jgi:hypothetical protein
MPADDKLMIDDEVNIEENTVKTNRLSSSRKNSPIDANAKIIPIAVGTMRTP